MACLKCDDVMSGGYECPECDCDYCKEHYDIHVKEPGTFSTEGGKRCSRCGDYY